MVKLILHYGGLKKENIQPLRIPLRGLNIYNGMEPLKELLILKIDLANRVLEKTKTIDNNV